MCLTKALPFVLRECEPEDVRIFKKIYNKMCREVCKKTKDPYFNKDRINDVEGPDGDKAGYVVRQLNKKRSFEASMEFLFIHITRSMDNKMCREVCKKTKDPYFNKDRINDVEGCVR
jgi:hypothetical protein